MADQHPLRQLACATAMVLAAGCSHLGFATAPSATPQALSNPLAVPRMDPDFLWEQIADTVDDYLPLAREQRVRNVGGVLTEGLLETRPRVGSTLLEPWGRDSTPGYEQWLSTIQSIRRTGRVRVIPTAEGYLVSVEVFKELEDVNQPESSSVSTRYLRHDGTLVRPSDSTDQPPETLGWIPLGRDTTLEQEILRHLQARLLDPAPIPSRPH